MQNLLLFNRYRADVRKDYLCPTKPLLLLYREMKAIGWQKGVTECLIVLFVLRSPELALAQGSASEILGRAFANDEAQARSRMQYIYREHAERRSTTSGGAKGRLSYTRDYENIFLQGTRVRKLIAINGKSLKGRAAEQQESKLRVALAERREQPVNTPGRKGLSFCDVSKADVLKLSNHTLIREEELRGRPAWVIQSVPKPDAIGSSAAETRALRYKHTYWIDRQDDALAEEYCEVVTPGEDNLPGSWSRRANEKREEPVWMISSLESESFTKDDHWFQSHRFFDFRKFSSESTVTFQQDRVPPDSADK